MSDASSANWIALLPTEVRAQLQARMVRRKYAHGQYIYRAGEKGSTQYQIVSGSVRLRVLSESGREATYVIYGPGNCIGYISAVDHGPRPQDVIAIGSVEVDCLSGSDFDELRGQFPTIDRTVQLHLCGRIRELFSMYEMGTLGTLRGRLAHQMIYLLDSSDLEAVKNGGESKLDLTQEMLASSVCATRQAISKIIKEWAECGLISYHYGRIRILNVERLREMADSRC